MTSDTPNRGTFAWLVLGVVIFTIYGSLVPFKFHARPLSEALDKACWVIENRANIQSLSDFVANIILGVPLGFCLLAALRLDKPGGVVWDVIVGLTVWPFCVLFAAAVEFSQLFFYERTSSASDVIAQGIGSLSGMLIWIVIGHRFVIYFRRVWQGDRIGGTAGRILVVYVAMLGIVQWLPLDLTLSPKELYDKNFKGSTQMVMVPFSEITRPGESKLPTWLELTALYFPAGLLAGCMKRTRQINTIILMALGLGFALEAGQLFVKSRTTSITDVWLGASGFFLGWSVMRMLKPGHGSGLSVELGLGLAQAWMFLLLAMAWYPFNFDRSIVGVRWQEVEWIPFAAAYEKNYLNSLEEAAAKTLLFTPLGAIIAGIGIRRVVRARWAVAVGIGIAAMMELGQLAMPSRTPGPTDLIFAAVGSWLGAAAALRIRAFSQGPAAPAPGRAVASNFVRFKVS